MRTILFITALFALSLFGASCRSSAGCNMSKTNSKLISGKYDFGKNKEERKYKRRNRHI